MKSRGNFRTYLLDVLEQPFFSLINNVLDLTNR
nr:MAG TPA: hypothetical protein [Caudoviricetes sp.]